MDRRFMNIVAVVGALAFIAAPVALLADDAQDRAKLVDSLESTLGKMAGEIRGFARDTNAQDVTDAVRLSIAVGKDLGALKAVQGDDKTAQDMVRVWPGELKEFQTAAVNLAKLKNEQLKFSNKSGAYVPLDCKKQGKELQAVIDKFLPKKDPDGLTEIPKTAKKVGAFASAAQSRARTTFEASEDWENAVARFAGADKWDPLADLMRAEAKVMAGDVAAKRKMLDASCAKLAQGEKNPTVVAARKAIFEDMGDDFAVLQKQVDAWEARAATYFKLDCEAMKKLHELYCDADIGDADSSRDLAKFKTETGRLTGKVAAEFSDVMQQLKDIIATRAMLEAEEATRKPAQKIFSELDDELKKMKSLKEKGSIKGMSLPVVQYYIKFGKEMHAQMERRYSCNVRDVPYPGGSERPDCVSAKDCMIYEFKPNSSSAMSKGRGQVATHKRRVDDYYSDFANVDDKFPASKYGGKAIMAEFKKSSCVKNGKFSIKATVKPYNRCEEKYQCIR